MVLSARRMADPLGIISFFKEGKKNYPSFAFRGHAIRTAGLIRDNESNQTCSYRWCHLTKGVDTSQDHAPDMDWWICGVGRNSVVGVRTRPVGLEACILPSSPPRMPIRIHHTADNVPVANRRERRCFPPVLWFHRVLLQT